MPDGPVSRNLCDRDAVRLRESEIMALIKGFENMCRPSLVDVWPHLRTKNQGALTGKDVLGVIWSGLIPTSSGVG